MKTEDVELSLVPRCWGLWVEIGPDENSGTATSWEPVPEMRHWAWQDAIESTLAALSSFERLLDPKGVLRSGQWRSMHQLSQWRTPWADSSC